MEPAHPVLPFMCVLHFAALKWYEVQFWHPGHLCSLLHPRYEPQPDQHRRCLAKRKLTDKTDAQSCRWEFGHRAPIWAVHDNRQNPDSSKTRHFLIRNSVPGRICHQIKSSERTPFLDRQKKGMNTLRRLLKLSRYCQGMRRYWDTGHVKFAFFNSIRFAIDILTNRIWAYQVFWQCEGCERSIGHNCWNCKAIFHDVRPVEPSFGPSWAIDSQLRMWSTMGRACLWLYNAL